jgi:hypothetical protein
MNRNYRDQWLKEPFEEGGHSCSFCGRELPHDDLLGYKKNNLFVITGYRCSRCNKMVRLSTVPENAPTPRPFDWRQL